MLLSSLRPESSWMALGKAVELDIELTAPALVGPAQMGRRHFRAQAVEFAAKTGVHLMPEFLPQAFQFGGDLADRGDSFLLAPHPVEVARKRLIGPSRGCGRAASAAGNVSSSPAVSRPDGRR